MQHPHLRLLRVVPSPRASKKWRAEWLRAGPSSPSQPRQAHTDFGARGYSDYTMHKDPARRARYRVRHARDPIHDPTTPGALAWHLLWGESTSLATNLRALRARFGV